MTRSTHCHAARFALGLVILALPALAPSALAQPVGGEALVELVPPGALVADGDTAVQLVILALDADGSALELLKAKVSTNAGSVGKVKSAGLGRYMVELVPPAATATQDIQLVLTGRTPTKAPVTRTFHLQALPPLPDRLVLEASPSAVTLGPGATSTLSMQVEPAAAMDVADLEVRAMVGSVANLTHLGGGRVTALYTAPPVNYPHLDIVTVVDKRDPSRLFAQLTLPLVGRADFPVAATAGSSVLLTVGEREFGPVVADAQGRAVLPLEVPPGVGVATVTTPQGSSQLDLGIPPFAQAAFITPYQGVPGDPSIQVPLRLVVATALGEPDSEARPAVQASAGTLGEPVYEGNGVYRVDFTPPVVAVPTAVQLLATLPGGSEDHRPQAAFQVVPALPDRLGLELTEATGGGGDAREARIQAVTAAGLGLPGQDISLGAVGASVRGQVRDLTDGMYSGSVVPQDGTMEIWADPACEPTGNPARELLLLPSTGTLAFEGWTSTILTVVALDELGHPVAGVPVTLSLVSGDGTLPAAVTTAGCGLARVGYSAGSAPGLAVLRASSGSLEAVTSILQGPGAVVQAYSPGASGSAHQLALRDTWTQRFPVLRTGSLPQAALAVAPVPAVAPTPAVPAPPVAPVAVSTEPVAALAIVPEPAMVAPGAPLILTVTATDAAGLGVAGEQLDLLVSEGAASAFTDLGDGRYQATLQVPKRQVEPIKVTVSTADGEQFRFLKVPVGVAAVAVAPVPVPEPTPAPVVEPTPEPTPEPTVEPAPPVPGFGNQGPVASTEPPKERTPRERKPAGPHRWLHVRGTGGVGSYGFEYVVDSSPRTILADGDPLPYEQSLVLEGADRELVPGGVASKQIVPQTDLRARAWLPGFSYLGADLRYRGHYLAVDTDAFAQYNEGPDLGYWDNFLTALVQGRYYHDLGDTRLWVGAAAGTVTTAVPVPAHWSPDGGPSALWFFPWGFTSLYGGLRGGVETGFGLELMAEAGLGTERWTGVFVREQSYELSYEVAEHVTVDLVVDFQARHILVPLEDVEPYEPMVQVYDTRLGANLGVGVAF